MNTRMWNSDSFVDVTEGHRYNERNELTGRVAGDMCMDFTIKPDVEVIFKFDGYRQENLYEGYRPAHLICEDYLTTGVHSYYNLGENTNKEIKGTITFISPETYPACLWIGKEIAMYEGKNKVGYAVITRIYNPTLCKSDKEGSRSDGA